MDKIKLLNRLKEVCTNIKRDYEEDNNTYQVVRYTNLLQSIDKEIKYYEKRNREEGTEQVSDNQ